MSLHQKRVTITAVDLSKVSENCVIVIRCEDEPITEAEFQNIGRTICSQVPDGSKMIRLKKGQTFTVEQLPKQPAPEAQKEI